MLCGKFQFKTGALTAVTVFLFSCGSASVNTEISKNPKAYPQAVLTINQGVTWYDKGCYEKAIQLFWDAHEQFSAMDLPEGVAASFNSIGNANYHLGDTGNAILFLNQALDIYEQLRQTQRRIKVLSDLAAAYMTDGNASAAKERIVQAEKLAEGGSGNGIDLLLAKGIWLTRAEKFEKARAVLLSAVDLIEPDDFAAEGTLNAALGHLELEAGNIDAARKYFVVALDADRRSGFYRGMADNLSELGRICARREEAVESLFYMQRSIKIYALLGARDKVEQLATQIESQADVTGKDVRLTLNIVNRWLKGEVHHLLCE